MYNLEDLEELKESRFVLAIGIKLYIIFKKL